MEIIDNCLVDGCGEDFAAAIHVLITKPNSANKRLVGAELESVRSEHVSSSEFDVYSTPKECIESVFLKKKKVLRDFSTSSEYVDPAKKDIVLEDLYLKNECMILRKCVSKQSIKNIDSCNSNVIKNIDQNKRETVLWKRCRINCKLDILLVLFIPQSDNDLCYAFVYTQNPKSEKFQTELNDGAVGNITIWLEANNPNFKRHSKWLAWLKETCYKQITKWCNAKIGRGNANHSQSKVVSKMGSTPSLRLVSLEEYDTMYNKLKLKYIKKLLDSKAWSTESTDPEKFIHEDIGIAVYLLLLWKTAKKQISFADIGCGNGLLVYILTQEGVGRGVGYDLRERKIWNTFRKLGADSGFEVDLRVATISPNEENLNQFDEFDWLIGNHSDELTPWLPLLSRKSCAKLFLLPCCPFDFYGKYQRRRTEKQHSSAYREYLDYIFEIGENCGFVMEEDRLRIPSTRRICFVARHDKAIKGCKKVQYENIQPTLNSQINVSSENVDVKIEAMLEASKCSSGKIDFSARSTIEKVRNCTKISKEDVIDPIVNTVVNNLLKMHDWTLESKPTNLVPPLPEKRIKLQIDSESKKIVELKHICDKRTDEKSDLGKWNAGGCISLNQISSLINPSLLVQLKSECGGLQTLLRNHNYIFVVKGGNVRLRCPLYDDISVGKRKKRKHNSNNDINKFRKTKICWLFDNHPQGCPVASKDCVWAHGDEELQKIMK